MEEEEADRLSVRHSLLLDVDLLGSKPTFTRLVNFHHPLLFSSLSLSPFFSLSPLGPLSVQGLFWCQENTHKQAATCSPTSTHTHKGRHRTITHNQKVSKGLSYLISIVIALSPTANPLVWLLSGSKEKARVYSKESWNKRAHDHLNKDISVSLEMELYCAVICDANV